MTDGISLGTLRALGMVTTEDVTQLWTGLTEALERTSNAAIDGANIAADEARVLAFDAFQQLENYADALYEKLENGNSAEHIVRRSHRNVHGNCAHAIKEIASRSSRMDCA